MLNWLQRFNTFAFLDNHQYHIGPHSEECLVGAGVRQQFVSTDDQGLAALQLFINNHPDEFLFGHLSYDLDASQATSHSNGFAPIAFFIPEIVVHLSEKGMSITGVAPETIYNDIIHAVTAPRLHIADAPVLKNRMEKPEYLDIISKLRQHILRGDCYEINFCQEFFAENSIIDPFFVYQQLSELSPNPFSALYRQDQNWLICASPERFLKREGEKIFSQPIKGTSRRTPSDLEEDDKKRNELFLSQKDRSENVMVVDLVRNDLARICEEGSVTVDELYGIYSFPQVHQMISTISGTLRPEITFQEIIRATFPMGSMTGAPKESVMKLINKYEPVKRGIFSGTLGYISPSGNFDFNVVIRSLIYNSTTGYLSFPAGSGITFYSSPEAEWEECLLKAEAIRQVLNH